jgi:hypothetical protein
MIQASITIRLAWWAELYLCAVAFFCNTFFLEPDMEKVEYWIMKGVTIDIG